MRALPVGLVVPPGALWRAWALDPVVLAGLLLAAAGYARGLMALAGRGRRPLGARHAVAFMAGLAALAAALLSPLDRLAGTLLSAHMAQHLILVAVAPPLIVYGRAGLVLRVGLPIGVRMGLRTLERTGPARRATRLSRSPLLVLLAGTASLWVWHLPVLYDLALANPALHAAEHLSFLVTAVGFWRLVINPGLRRRLGYGPAMLLSFGTMLQGAALGALITLSARPLYPAYQAGAALWGTTPIADQQLAGALMWVPPGGLYLVTIVLLAARWLAEIELYMRRKEGHRASPVSYEPGAAAVLLGGAREGLAAPEGSL